MQNFLLGSPLHLCWDADPSDGKSFKTKNATIATIQPVFDRTKPYCSAQVSSFPEERVFWQLVLFPNGRLLEILEKILCKRSPFSEMPNRRVHGAQRMADLCSSRVAHAAMLEQTEWLPMFSVSSAVYCENVLNLAKLYSGTISKCCPEKACIPRYSPAAMFWVRFSEADSCRGDDLQLAMQFFYICWCLPLKLYI